uniref:Uncharacterized protein n=1 Tax=Lygus hesperus TaxID=30085 RepID=A0A0A9XFV1_LYGHE
MDGLPKIRLKKELFGQIIRSNETNFSPSPKEDSEARWRKSLLIRDLDLVQASIKIILAMPSASKHTSKLGKLIHASLKDVEGVLLHNYIPIRKLDLSSPSPLLWNRERDAEKYDDNAYSLPGPWKRALVARNLDLVHTSVHALLLNLPQKHINQLADTALAALKDLQNVILNDNSSSQQITKYKADESENDGPARKSFDGSSKTQTLHEWECQSESQDGMESDNMTASSLDHPHEDPVILEKPPQLEIPSESIGPWTFKEPSSPSDLQKLPTSLQTQPVEPKKLNVVPPLRAESGFPSHGNKKVTRTNLCKICKNRFTNGCCVACRNFALKMENSMKQNVFYECSHVDNSGGSKCKVCRFNLILMYMPNYASHKVEVIRKQIGPRPKSQNENSQEPVTSMDETGNEDGDMRSRVSSPNISSTSSLGQSTSTVNILPQKPIPSPLMEQSLVGGEPSIFISSVSSLATSEPDNSLCPICASSAPAGHCSACSSFAQRLEALMKKDIFYECAHVNNAGSPKCRVCRYSRILLLRADEENNKKIVP